MQDARTCPTCGAENRVIAKLCDQCGTGLITVSTAAPVPRDWEADLNHPKVIAARLLNHAYSVTYRLIEHRLKEVGKHPSPVQYRALSLIKLLPPPVTPSVLALHLALDSRTVSDLVSRLETGSKKTGKKEKGSKEQDSDDEAGNEEGGWVRRMRDLPDRRAVRLELTEQGETLLNASWGPAIAAYQEVWSVVEVEELRPVIGVLHRVRDAALEKLGYRAEDIYALGPPELKDLEPGDQ